MSGESFRFRTGAFECMVVRDGALAYPYPAKNVFINFFVNAAEEDLRKVLREHNLDLDRWEEYVSPYVSLLINAGQRQVLVDTGAGGFAPTTGKLIPNLKAGGVAPEDIDVVILTHCHIDHIGGAVDSEGKPAFPNARYVIWRDEWDFWTSEKAAEAVAKLKIEDEHVKEGLITGPREKLLPIRDHLDLIDRETDIVPGVRAVEAPGHTPGHMAVAVTSGGEELLYISDTVIHPIHLQRPGWYSAVVIDPILAVATRRRIFERAVAEKTLVHASHFPFPGLGYVVQDGEGWRWQAL
jgi:glyoxylase-like metal-dependent hydrolase (beta-lactamase superfamily II)